MTTYQILSLVCVAAVAAWYYLPSLKVMLPAKPKPEIMGHIEDVVRIRDAYQDTQVTDACNALLQVLLEVK